MSTEEKAPAAADTKSAAPESSPPKPPAAPAAATGKPAASKSGSAKSSATATKTAARPAGASGPIRVSGKTQTAARPDAPVVAPGSGPKARPSSEATKTDRTTGTEAQPGRKEPVFKPRPVNSREPRAVSGPQASVAPPVVPSAKPVAVPMGTPSAPSRPTKTQTSRPPAKSAEPGVRKVRLVLQRVSPLSVMKLAFLLSFAFGIGLIACVAVLWLFLDSAHVFASISDLMTQAAGDVINFHIDEILSFSRVLSVTVLLALADIIILTVLSTIGAMLYNVVARGVGGVHVVLTDE